MNLLCFLFLSLVKSKLKFFAEPIFFQKMIISSFLIFTNIFPQVKGKDNNCQKAARFEPL